MCMLIICPFICCEPNNLLHVYALDITCIKIIPCSFIDCWANQAKNTKGATTNIDLTHNSIKLFPILSSAAEPNEPNKLQNT